MRTRAHRSAGKRRENSASSANATFGSSRCTRVSDRPRTSTSSAPTRPNTSAATTAKAMLYCASSVVRGFAHCEPSATASWKLSIAIVAILSAAKRCARCTSSAASIAGCAQRHTGYALKYCSRMRQRLPRSLQNVLASSRSMVSAGAPVKPSRASSAAVSPTCAPQPEPSFTIVGESQARNIWPRGPKYSATPSACRVVAASNTKCRAATAAHPSEFHAPEQW